MLESLAKGEVFCYVALNKSKEDLGHAITLEAAQALKNARTVVAVSFSGKRTVVSRKVVDLFNKKVWQSVEKKK